jgi:hypothetical protein
MWDWLKEVLQVHQFNTEYLRENRKSLAKQYKDSYTRYN